VITDAIPPVEDKKDEPVTEEAKDEPKKENRRLSRFETFFKSKPKADKKEESVASPVEEPIASEAPKVDETPAVVEPVAEPTPVVAAVDEDKKDEVKEDDKPREASPSTDKRKSSFLTGLKGFTQKVRSPSSEHPPATSEPKKSEETPAFVDSTPAPVSAEPATEVPATTEPVTEETVAGETSKSEKRRSSFFGFGTTKSKKGEATPATEEPAKTDAVEEPVKPIEASEEAAPEVPKKSTDEKVEPASPKEHKESPFASIGRRVSKVIRGDKAKKETKPAAAVEESKEESKPEVSEAPAATLPEPISIAETPATAPTASIGDVVPEAVTVGNAPKSTPTVSATA
jgi:hypothetical protein